MTPKLSKSDIGSEKYNELLQAEADFWGRVSTGRVDTSVAVWRNPELAHAISGDLHARALDQVAARGQRVLDLGCSNGTLAIPLARRGCVVDGVDISFVRVRQGAEQVAAARAEANLPGDVRFFVGDLNRLGLAPASYDVVLAAAVLHHVLDLDALLTVVQRALKPGGALICLDHMESSKAGQLLRYLLLFLLPTEVPYWRKPLHLFNRVMARLYRRWSPARPAPPAFTLPERSPFEDVSGSEAVTLIGQRFVVETYQTHLAFADIVAGHLRLGSEARAVQLARRLRRLDDWLIRRRWLRGDMYYLVAHKA